jgi:biotin carboxyl carrier protein
MPIESLCSEATGRVVSIMVEEGAEVTEGQEVATVKP